MANLITVKILTVGDEILIGQIVNTNATYISEKLYSRGFKIVKVVTVGDNEKDLLNELRDSLAEVDITIITGGLGPTHDDITKPVFTDFFGDTLIRNEEVLSKVISIFAKRGVVMPDVNCAQADVPSTSKVIRNENGTAPGIWMEKNDKVFVALPGVPFEMKAMMDDFVLPMLIEKFESKMDYTLLSRTILTSGVGESTLSEMIGDVDEILEGQKMAYLPSPLGVRLRIDVNAASQKEAESVLGRIEKRIIEKAGEYVYGTGDDLLEEIIGIQLKKSGKTLSLAESCTGGLLSKRITDISGSSEYFMGGICSYSNTAKMEILNVNPETIEKFGAVSEETALDMAEKARLLFKTDIAVSVTGVAGPGGGTETKPVGLIYIGYSDADKTYAKKFLLGDNRDRNRLRAAQSALTILRKELS